MNRKCEWLAAAMIAAAWTCPVAAAGDGWYIGAQAGGSFLEDAENSGSGSDITSTTKNGYSLSGAAGYRFGSGLRADAEFGYRRQGFDRLQIRADGGLGAAFGVGSLNGATVNATGHISALSLLANLWYDLDLGCAVKPYAGGGVGAAQISATDVAVSGVTIVNGSDTVFAFQLGAGVGYEVFPAAILSIDYRYFQAIDPTFKDQVLGTSFRSEYHSHDIRLGVRYQF
jgi:outer membrane autotransporter protein